MYSKQNTTRKSRGTIQFCFKSIYTHTNKRKRPGASRPPTEISLDKLIRFPEQSWVVDIYHMSQKDQQSVIVMVGVRVVGRVEVTAELGFQFALSLGWECAVQKRKVKKRKNEKDQSRRIMRKGICTLCTGMYIWFTYICIFVSCTFHVTIVFFRFPLFLHFVLKHPLVLQFRSQIPNWRHSCWRFRVMSCLHIATFLLQISTFCLEFPYHPPQPDDLFVSVPHFLAKAFDFRHQICVRADAEDVHIDRGINRFVSTAHHVCNKKRTQTKSLSFEHW